MTRYRLAAAIALATATPAMPAVAQGKPTILKGNARRKVSLALGRPTQTWMSIAHGFHCDTAVITFPRYKRVLIQFLQKADKRANMIGFAGQGIEGGAATVDHLYLNDGRTLDVTKGHCQTWWKANGEIKTLLCGASLERGDVAVATAIMFDTGPTVRRHRK